MGASTPSPGLRNRSLVPQLVGVEDGTGFLIRGRDVVEQVLFRSTLSSPAEFPMTIDDADLSAVVLIPPKCAANGLPCAESHLIMPLCVRAVLSGFREESSGFAEGRAE